jgi:hypothetical protein
VLTHYWWYVSRNDGKFSLVIFFILLFKKNTITNLCTAASAVLTIRPLKHCNQRCSLDTLQILLCVIIQWLLWWRSVYSKVETKISEEHAASILSHEDGSSMFLRNIVPHPTSPHAITTMNKNTFLYCNWTSRFLSCRTGNTVSLRQGLDLLTCETKVMLHCAIFIPVASKLDRSKWRRHRTARFLLLAAGYTLVFL